MSICEPRRIETSYLGYPLLITDSFVTVRSPEGRKLASLTSVSKARRFVKDYRRMTRGEV